MELGWVPLKDALAKGGESATCASCHMEYEGEYAHNMVRRVRWANYPFVPGVAENITSEWSEKRLDSWAATCSQCHSERFASTYLELMDKGTLEGLAKYQEAHDIVKKLYDEGLLTGQKKPIVRHPLHLTNQDSANSPNYSGRKATTLHR